MAVLSLLGGFRVSRGCLRGVFWEDSGLPAGVSEVELRRNPDLPRASSHRRGRPAEQGARQARTVVLVQAGYRWPDRWRPQCSRWCTRGGVYSLVYPALLYTSWYTLPCLPCPVLLQPCVHAVADWGQWCTPPGPSWVPFWSYHRSRTRSSGWANIPGPRAGLEALLGSQRWF